LRRVDRQMFELKETNALEIIDDLAKDFLALDEKDFRKVDVAKNFKISKDFNKAIYLNKEFNAKENCFGDTTIANFCLASIRATTLTFLIKF